MIGVKSFVCPILLHASFKFGFHLRRSSSSSKSSSSIASWSDPAGDSPSRIFFSSSFRFSSLIFFSSLRSSFFNRFFSRRSCFRLSFAFILSSSSPSSFKSSSLLFLVVVLLLEDTSSGNRSNCVSILSPNSAEFESSSFLVLKNDHACASRTNTNGKERRITEQTS